MAAKATRNRHRAVGPGGSDSAEVRVRLDNSRSSDGSQGSSNGSSRNRGGRPKIREGVSATAGCSARTRSRGTAEPSRPVQHEAPFAGLPSPESRRFTRSGATRGDSSPPGPREPPSSHHEKDGRVNRQLRRRNTNAQFTCGCTAARRCRGVSAEETAVSAAAPQPASHAPAS